MMNTKNIFLSACFFVASLACFASADAAGASKNTFGVGVEGFRDKYTISDLNQDDTANFGSVTGYYQRAFGKSFLAFDGRVSYGTESYKSTGHSELNESPVGKISGIPQWDMELRSRFGITNPLWGGSFSPYLGVGVHYRRDEGKGYVTDQNYETFDTRTFQFYIPIGASLALDAGNGWTITPQAEVEYYVYGDVDKRLTSLVHSSYIYYGNADIRQHGGYGARSELMFGKSSESGYAWQIGPFVRYSYIGTSTKAPYHDLATGGFDHVKEPANSRTQVGVAARVLW